MTPGLYSVQCLSLGGKVGVSIFILITGYFMVNKNFSGRKAIRLYLEVFFYSIVLFSLMTVFFLHKFDSAAFRIAVMPLSYNTCWFITSYLILYLFTPFLNAFIRSLSKNFHFSLICLSVGIWTVWYQITMSNPNYSDFLWLILLYITGAYIRLYPPKRFTGRISNLLYIFALTLLACLNLYMLNNSNPNYYDNAAYFYDLDNFYIFFISLFLFLIFIHLKIPYSKWINTAASATLGVYLIQENYWVRPFLWTNLFHGADFQNSSQLIPYALGAVLLVFVITVIIDLIRQQLLEKPVMKFIDRFGPSISVPFIHIWNEIWQKIYIDNPDAPK